MRLVGRHPVPLHHIRKCVDAGAVPGRMEGGDGMKKAIILILAMLALLLVRVPVTI